jgi:hypothetical protein
MCLLAAICRLLLLPFWLLLLLQHPQERHMLGCFGSSLC